MRIQKISNNTQSFCSLHKIENTAVKRATKKLYLNLETMVGYNGKTSYRPVPQSIKEPALSYFKMLKIDWRTHLNKQKTIKNI